MNSLCVVAYIGKLLEHKDSVEPKDVQYAIRNDENLDHEVVAIEDIIGIMNILVESSFLEQTSSYGLGVWRRHIPPFIKSKLERRGDKHYRTRRDDQITPPSGPVSGTSATIH